jgi:hypothetical protein
MGRTTPTATQLIDRFEGQLSAYAHTLRKEDRIALQRLFAMIRDQSAAISGLYADVERKRRQSDEEAEETAYLDPFVVFALSMFIGLMQEVTHLEEQAARDAITVDGEVVREA